MAEATMPPAGPVPVFEPFVERFPWRGRHLQTIRNFLRRPTFPDVPAGERLRFPMPDGSGDVLLGALNRQPTDTGRPLAVLVHGLTGCETGPYMLSTARHLLAAGFPVLRLNLRGAGPSRPLCRFRYHAGRTADLRAVLAQLPPDLAAGGVVMAGYSLGGNALLKLLGESDLPVPVLAAASVSAPIDLAATSRRFMQPGNLVYHDWLLGRMKTEVLAPGPPLEPRWVEALGRCRTVWDFDELFIGPWNGWSGADEYYAVNSAIGFLGTVQVPTLVIHALDDSWIPGAPYENFDWPGHPRLVPLLSPRGGHVGFHGRTGVWHDRCIATFFAGRTGG